MTSKACESTRSTLYAQNISLQQLECLVTIDTHIFVTMSDYETRRLENIKRNQALIEELGLKRDTKSSSSSASRPSTKKRKLSPSFTRPSRVSARIASAPVKATYNEDEAIDNTASTRSRPRKSGFKPVSIKVSTSPSPPPADLETIRESWSSWTAEAAPPTRDENGTFHFESHPSFQPNKSPSELLTEGCFGGSYYRRLYSKALHTWIEDDWKELPETWIQGLKIDTFLTSEEYDPEVNKYKVKCGQSIEEWEAAGWIRHEFDVRGWFQWYTRFFRGRRCDDDERQVGRWERCVGERGRWRRTLLKRYLQAGVRNVADEGEDEAEVSPVLHQTCLHWAWEIRQDVLDRVWKQGL